MDKFWEKLEYILALIGGAVVVYFEHYWLLYCLVGAAILFDLITGMLAAIIAGPGLSSSIARAGFFKKLVLLASVAFGTFLDVLLPYAAELLGIDLAGKLLVSSVVAVYICVMESISIIENIYKCTGGAIPQWIAKILKYAKDELEKGGESSGN